MIWTIISFVILLYLLKKFAWTPILKALEDRENGIKNNIEAAKNTRDEAQKLLEDYNRKLAEAQAQAQSLLAGARQDAERVRDELMVKAKEDAVAQVDKARRQIDQERQEAINAIRVEVASMVVLSVEKIIGKTLDPHDHQRLILNSLKESAN